ncbi:MAG: amylo-alpha-1,6-glucosidase [Geminicoccaceae bacterium]|nr:MAG: amylo-alpha-1,6-glucosidase [Geminicoccaceae bacterium]
MSEPEPAADPPERPTLGPVASVRVPATRSLGARDLRTLKAGELFGLFGPEGDVAAGPGSPEGLFWRDTRLLGRLSLRLEGHAPLLLGSRLSEDGQLLLVDLANPDFVDAEGRLLLPADRIHLQRVRLLRPDGLFERLRVLNCDRAPRRLELGLLFELDFVDIFEVRGHRPAGHGTVAVEAAGDGLRYRYTARDGVATEVTLRAEPKPRELRRGQLSWTVELEPGERCAFDWAVLLEPAAARPVGFTRALSRLRRERRAAPWAVARIETSSSLVDEIFARALGDLRMLTTDTPHGPYPYAGLPWFATIFGRDGAITALEMLELAPGLARGVLEVLAATQARTLDPARDAEPGKILHEAREGELARLGEVPFGRYYGSVDATPLFVVLAGRFLRRTGDLATIRGILPAIRAALDWIERFGDGDGDGFVEYGRVSERGLVNQGWKDSEDAVFHADGRPATPPIALVEVQAYVHATWSEAARLFERLGEPDEARRCAARAAALAERFREAFWSEELGSFVLALDGAKRPCRVRTSNAGHVLLADLASPAQVERLAELLASPRFFSGWGIRTVAEGEPGYVPISYHNGSVWPHDTALVAMGFARHGRTELARRLFDGLLAAAAASPLRRLPELFCGFRRRRGAGPTPYPSACSPQAWAAAALPACLGASLGLEIEAEPARIRLAHPRLPASLDWVRLRGLEVGAARVDLLLRRHEEDVAVNVLERTGAVEIQVVL